LTDEEELKKRLAEYAALEARMHSDSSISYSIFVGFTVAALAFMASVFTLYYQGNINIFVTAPLMLVPILLLTIAKVIRSRFDYTGHIRMARAVEIEQQLGFYSFRLFEPWRIAPTDEYYRILGELAPPEYGRKGATSMAELICSGKKYFNNPPQRVSKTLRLMYRIVFSVIALYWLLVLVSLFDQLAKISGAVFTAYCILLVILIATGLGNWLSRPPAASKSK
jgi:hypothetical protein